MASVIRLQSSILRKLLPRINQRLISTSQKKSETVSADECAPKASISKTAADNKNWISYGFEVREEKADRNALHSVFFFSITISIVLAGFYLMYVPDYNLRDWAQREAFLELKRREDAGLPLVDPNLIDPSKIMLPTDEELCDTEIII